MAWGEMDAEAKLLAVVEVDLWANNGRFLCLKMGGEFVLQLIQNGFDVLASPKRVRFVIRACAGIVAHFKPANSNGVLPTGIRVGDSVIGKDAILTQVLNLEFDGPGALSADVDLFLAEHPAFPVVRAATLCMIHLPLWKPQAGHVGRQTKGTICGGTA